ncbi:tryptophan 2,3-dioxygenase family protein [Pleionea sp. CnH1-48]|uniref:tryptophan 2,3-dioxygenase family protein n=1 Tax=Pleionea sp. CnH1-48 TaxID=2954494 RepID=UPI0020971E36|nr:tryptophan 2,3-dioxygenase family protein [Pleionea sp. CnH1-48]MCO7223458.1 tryptophan 2,3-dioxygenase [Pleionea sp. CnH1-48]
MQRNTKPCYYGEYLQLDKLLDSQYPVSQDYGNEAHDEMLFIVTHQAYELWFKQMLHELRSIYQLFANPHLPEKSLGMINARLSRIKSIQKLLIDQISVMETMTPLDFLDFRDYLVPASGFQSIQFKEIEILLGLKSEFRINFDKESFYSRLNETDRTHLLKMEDEPSLFDCVESWLERMPFFEFGDFKFWQTYRQAVDEMLDNDRKIIENNDYLSEADREFQLKDLDNTLANFDALLDEEQYAKLKEDGRFRMSQKSLLGAVFINLYRDEPMFQAPFQLLTALVDLDEHFTSWRYRHTIMVLRMLGTKIGTGGSSGHDYLRKTTENNRFFKDLFTLPTFLLPRSALPELPEALRRALNFYFHPEGE